MLSDSLRYSALTLLLGTLCAASQPAFPPLTSPDGRLIVQFSIVPDQNTSAPAHLVYSVSFRGEPLLNESGLGLEFEGQPILGADVRLLDATPSQTDESYRLLTGKVSAARNHFNALRLDLRENAAPSRKLAIEARAYDDAVAFRYVVPEQPGLKDFRLSRENTQFRISKDATTYALVLPNYRSMYESEFLKLPITAFSNQGGVASTVLLGLPLLMNVPGVGWLAITEAGLRDSTAMYLVNPSGNWGGHWFETRLAPHVEDPTLAVSGTLPYHSAWRVLMVASEPAKLIESTVLTSLNPPAAFSDTSWIHPGKAAWDWWSGSIGPDGKSAYTTETMKYYVDFAATSGFPYMLVDAGWFAHGDITRMNGRVDIPELARYAAQKNVKVWIWLGYQEASRQMDEAFPIYEKWGVAGVKIDFIERDDQAGIAFYYHAADMAARHHLMVDFHGCTKPSGLDRTYPNIMGYEAVAGMEQSKAGARDNPDHRVTLPFTRMLAGRMDYTPGGFDNVTFAEFEPRGRRPMVMGTRAQQLAMYVVYEAPFQMVSDCPQAYKDQPAFDFIKSVPTTWDETRGLAGAPGQFVTIARRHGTDWFIGSMSNWQPRRLEIPLTFLGPGHFLAEIYADSPDSDRFPKKILKQKKRVSAATVLKAQLAPGGGYAVRLQAER